MLCARYLLNSSKANSGELSTTDIWEDEPVYEVGNLANHAMASGSMTWDADTTSKILNNTAFTWMGWIYVNPNVGTINTQLFGNNGYDANNNRKFSLYQYPTRNDFYWSWMNDAGAHTFSKGTLKGVLKDYEWTHVAITYGSNTVKVYINGVLELTNSNVVSKSSSFAYATKVFYDNPCRRLQDVRIYNECVDAETIAIIGKGLDIHLKLNGAESFTGSAAYVSSTPRYNQAVSFKNANRLKNVNRIINRSNSIALSFWFNNAVGVSYNIFSSSPSSAYTLVKQINYSNGYMSDMTETKLNSSDGVTYLTGTETTTSSTKATEKIYTGYARCGFEVSVKSKGLQISVDDSTFVIDEIPNNRWHHVVINVTGKYYVTIFVDGELAVSGNVKSDYTVSRSVPSSSFEFNGSYFMSCFLSDFRTYGRSLTVEEIQGLYGIKVEDYTLTN